MRSSSSIRLAFLGSALVLVGCGGDAQANRCPPLPDGSPNPNCAGGNRTHVAHGAFVGSGRSSSGAATAPSSGVHTGGFGATGGSSASAAS